MDEKTEEKTGKKHTSMKAAALFLAATLVSGCQSPAENTDPNFVDFVKQVEQNVDAPETEKTEKPTAEFSVTQEMIDKIMGDKSIPNKYKQIVIDAATEFSIDPILICRVINQESKWKPRAKSRVGAMGLTQVMPETAAEMAKKLKMGDKYNVYDPKTNIRMGVAYLAWLNNLKYVGGEPKKLLAAYNWGCGNLNRFLRNGKDIDVALATGEGLPKETQNYVKRILELN